MIRAPGTLDIAGEREQGQDVRTENVTAAMTISNIVKSSLGPQGLDKMLVDEIGEVVVTNDGATILQQIEVAHPAAKVLVELAQTQDESVGDGTTSVVILAAELLKRGNDLIKDKIHATTVISGFKLSAKKSIEFLRTQMRMKTEELGREALVSVAATTMSSKILGSDAQYFGELVVDALQSVKTVSSEGKEKYPVKSINILKQHGRSAKESQLVKGYAIDRTRVSQQMPKTIKKAKIALLDMNLQKQKMKLGISIEINDPTQLEGVREREQSLIKDRIKLLLDAGANVILTTKAVDDLCSKYFVEAGAIAVRRCEKKDLKRIAKLTGGTLISSFADLEGGESFDASSLGHADEVIEERVGDRDFLFIKGCKNTKSQTLILRGANDFMLDEMDRTIHDALCAVRRVLETKHIVPGGGAVEAALSIHLQNFATTLESREQLAIAEFAEALLVIPKTLAVNAACDSTDLVAKLCAYHNEAQTKQDKKDYMYYGLDLMEGKIRDNVTAGVLEPAMTKIKYLQYATEAATTILRIDDMIKLAPKQEQAE